MKLARAALLLFFYSSVGWIGGCSKPTPPSGDPSTPKTDASAAGPAASSAAVQVGAPTPPNATTCPGVGTVQCLRFATSEDAFKHVVAMDPIVLAVGEAHAQKGTEGIASSTKRFTESFLPLLAPKASDIVVELWAPDPKCMKAVKQVASAQRPVTSAQAAPTQDEYTTMGLKARDAGIMPWLLRPTCDDFAALADAGTGAEAIPPMLALIKRLTATKIAQLHERNTRDGGTTAKRMLLAYGGAMHNDLQPSDANKEYSFGPELDRLTGGKYVELDLIVPEFVKKTPVWEKLPWYASWDADKGPHDKATLYVVAPRSFVLVFPSSAPR
jgi:hypothetical protein